MVWLQQTKGVASPSFALFASAKVGAIAEEFIHEKALSCSHARIAKLIGSLVAAARFTYTALSAKGRS